MRGGAHRTPAGRSVRRSATEQRGRRSVGTRRRPRGRGQGHVISRWVIAPMMAAGTGAAAEAVAVVAGAALIAGAFLLVAGYRLYRWGARRAQFWSIDADVMCAAAAHFITAWMTFGFAVEAACTVAAGMPYYGMQGPLAPITCHSVLWHPSTAYCRRIGRRAVWRRRVSLFACRFRADGVGDRRGALCAGPFDAFQCV